MTPEIRMPSQLVDGVECYSRHLVREEIKGTGMSSEFDDRWAEFLLHFGGDRLWFDAVKAERIFDGWGWK